MTTLKLKTTTTFSDNTTTFLLLSFSETSKGKVVEYVIEDLEAKSFGLFPVIDGNWRAARTLAQRKIKSLHKEACAIAETDVEPAQVAKVATDNQPAKANTTEPKMAKQETKTAKQSRIEAAEARKAAGNAAPEETAEVTEAVETPEEVAETEEVESNPELDEAIQERAEIVNTKFYIVKAKPNTGDSKEYQRQKRVIGRNDNALRLDPRGWVFLCDASVDFDEMGIEVEYRVETTALNAFHDAHLQGIKDNEEARKAERTAKRKAAAEARKEASILDGQKADMAKMRKHGLTDDQIRGMLEDDGVDADVIESMLKL